MWATRVSVGALGWVAACEFSVISQDSLEIHFSIFFICYVCSSLAYGHLVKVGLQLHAARLQGLDEKARVSHLHHPTMLTVTLPGASGCSCLLTETSGLLFPTFPPAYPMQPEVLKSQRLMGKKPQV